VQAVRASTLAAGDAAGGDADGSEGEVEEALRLLEAWDNTASADARGAVLFVEWWERYMSEVGRARPTPESAGFPAAADALFRVPWSVDEPVTTPRGLGSPRRAVKAFHEALEATRKEWGGWDVAWGDVHRARLGDLDLPASGCDGILGCFRVLWFTTDEDGKRRIRGGDGWVSAVEFTDPPRAYTILAYGQSSREESAHHTDQLEMFLEGRMKPIAFTEEDVEARAVRTYRPGER